MTTKSDEQKRIEKENYLLSYDGPDRVISSIELAELCKTRPAIPKLSSGLPLLDRTIDGFEPGELIAISGPTGHGKTLLCKTLMASLRNKSVFSLFLTYEVSAEKIAQEHDTPETVIFLPLEHKPMDIEWLKERCLEAKIRYGCQAVFIDHLHYVVDFLTNHNMSLEIGSCMRALKQLAKELKMAIFVVCHVGKLQDDKDLSINNIRDSSFVAQEVDTVLMVQRRKDRSSMGDVQDSMLQGLSLIRVLKARRTGNIGIHIKARKEGNKIVELPEETND